MNYRNFWKFKLIQKFSLFSDILTKFKIYDVINLWNREKLGIILLISFVEISIRS